MRVRALPCSLLLSLLAGCPTPLPGESVGTFEVEGRLEKNECGPEAVPARDPVELTAEIRVEDGRATWRRPNAPLIPGVVTSDGAYEFEMESRLDVLEGDPEQGRAACVLIQREVVTARVTGRVMGSDGSMPSDGEPPSDSPGDGGAAMDALDAELEGSHTIDFLPVSGSDCTPVLAVAGGPFRELPCALEYDLAGTERGSF